MMDAPSGRASNLGLVDLKNASFECGVLKSRQLASSAYTQVHIDFASGFVQEAVLAFLSHLL